MCSPGKEVGRDHVECYNGFTNLLTDVALHQSEFQIGPGIALACMTSSVSNVTAGPKTPRQTRSLGAQFLRDLGGVALIAIASLAAGLVINRF